MQEIFDELKQIRNLVNQVLHGQENGSLQPWSPDKLTNIAAHYNRAKQLRDDWISDHDLYKILPGCWHGTGAFLRQELGFLNCVKDGHYYMYYKPDLIALKQELKAKNIDLSRYMDYKRSETEFEKKFQQLEEVKKKDPSRKPFVIPAGKKDITTSMIPAPDTQLIRDDLNQLKEEFGNKKYVQYIDIYKGNHAMLKSMYYYEKYLEPKLKRACKKWVEDFNYANHTMKLATNKKENSNPNGMI